MVPVSALPKVLARNNPGFASVYWFSEEHALEIRARENSQGLSSYPVAADRVTIDIDDGDVGLKPMLEALDSRGYGYSVWVSGGKGYHIEIPHELIYDICLPYSHLCFMEALGVPFDRSIYQHGRAFRLPGTIHKKTGKRKEFLMKIEGTQPVIELKEPPVFDLKFSGGEKTIQTVLSQLLRLAMSEPTKGNRHTRIWSAASSAAEAGLPASVALALLNEINQQWTNPKSPDEVESAVTQAYRQTKSSLSES